MRQREHLQKPEIDKAIWAEVHDPDLLIGVDNNGAQHPTPEQLLFRMAVDRGLTHEQGKIWELYNYDRLTTVQIAKRFKVSQPTISKRIKVIEALLAKWCLDHAEVYKTLKEASHEQE